MTVIANELIERFLDAFNRIDAWLRAATNKPLDDEVSFKRVLRASSRPSSQRDRDLLGDVADLRNLLTHGKKATGKHVATPQPWLVDALEAIELRLTKPDLVVPRYQRLVETLDANASIVEMLTRIRERDYSQFPVFDGDAFVGLVTENGLAQWLARHVHHDGSLVDLGEHHVREVLALEETRDNFQFVSRSLPVDDLVTLFQRHALLEAALITERGKATESLVGIATRWDIVNGTEACVLR